MATISRKQKIRREYMPLVCSVSVACDTPQSPPVQTFDALCEDGAQYTPDRSLMPTVLRPVVCAGAPDGTADAKQVNDRLAQIKWYADGKPVDTDPDWAGLYSIDMSDTQARGTLTIMRNVGPEERIAIHIEAVVADTRKGCNIPVVSDPITLSTVTKSEGEYAIDIDDTSVHQYNPLTDPLAIDDYRRSHGMKCLPAADRESVASNINSYIRSMEIRLRYGGKRVTASADIALKLFSVGSDGSHTELGDMTELIGRPGLMTPAVFDLRQIDRGLYIVKAMRGGMELARKQFQLKRQRQMYDIETCNRIEMAPGDTVRTDMVIVTAGGLAVQSPERCIDIRWVTSTQKVARMEHGIGEVAVIDLEKAGAATADSMYLWTESDHKEAHRYAGNANMHFTDSLGNPYIFN